MATRSQVREVVVQLLYAYGSGNSGISKFIDDILIEHKIKNAQSEFAKSLFFGIVENLESLDSRIKHQLQNWDFDRVGDVERAILRLGVYEVIFSKLDKAVIINEALELAKSFCNEPSVKFINGILDGIAKNAEIPLEVIQESLQKMQIAKKAQLDSTKPQKPQTKAQHDSKQKPQAKAQKATFSKQKHRNTHKTRTKPRTKGQK